MKSRLQKYGKTIIIMLAIIFIVLAVFSMMPFVDKEKIPHIFTGFGGLLTSISIIMGLTIARYGARETALSLKGGYSRIIQKDILSEKTIDQVLKKVEKVYEGRKYKSYKMPTGPIVTTEGELTDDQIKDVAEHIGGESELSLKDKLLKYHNEGRNNEKCD